MNVLAFDIGGTKFSAAVFSGTRLVKRATWPTNREGGAQWMMEQLFVIGHRWGREYAIERCGIGFGGPVNFAGQRVALSTHVEAWQDCALPELMRAELGVPVIMDNDANVGALGEAVHGAGAGLTPLFYMTLSTGVGGGIVLENGIYRGADSFAGEIGHVCVEPGGPQCLCGATGCVERMCSGLWLEHDYGKSPRELLRDPDFAAKYVVALARGLKTIIMIVNPRRIVLGGGISKAGAYLLEPLNREMERQTVSWLRPSVDIVPSALQDDSVLYGALELARALD